MPSNSKRAGLLASLLSGGFSLFFSAQLFGQDEAQAEIENPAEAAVVNYRQALAEMQGGYNESFIEINLDLAATLDELSRFDEAADAYEQALQTMRIRDGLYSANQLSLLERAIDSALMNRDWELVNRNFYIALSVLENSVAISEPEYEQWVRWFTSWQIAAQRSALDVAEGGSPLEDSVRQYAALMDNLASDAPDYLEKRFIYTREKSLAHYFTAMAIYAQPYDEFAASAPETISGQRCYVVIRNGQPTTICSNTQVPNPDFFESRQQVKSDALQFQIRQILEGYQSLIGELESTADSSPELLVRATLELGDMNFLLRDLDHARALYSRAHELLVEAGLEESLGTSLMDLPRDIIGNMSSDNPRAIGVFAATPSGLVSFDVTEEGSVQNLGIIGTEADLETENQEAITERLRQSAYRPRLEAGIPVSYRFERIPAADL